MSLPGDLPENVHVSKHPCLMAKLSRLRSKQTEAREVKSLVNEIATILGCEALASAITAVDGPQVRCPGDMTKTGMQVIEQLA
jgi:uracil phosphoribosyltransferase